MRPDRFVVFGVILLLTAIRIYAAPSAEHPRLLFSRDEISAIKQRAESQILKPVTGRLMERAEWQLRAPPIIPSLTKRGEPNLPGESKGIESARTLQGRVFTLCMAYTLTNEKKYRDRAVAELRQAIADWRIWVDTAHRRPFDLMTGEVCLTFGIAYDWLYNDLTAEERRELREGAEKRGLQPYLQAATTTERPYTFLAARHNWNPVCNGGAAVLALALEGESELAAQVLNIAAPAMKPYWDHLAEDGGWDEGTGYWTYGHRYAFIAAEALRRTGKPGGAERFQHKGARNTGYFPLVFNPGTRLTASFGDSTSRASDPIYYLLGREYKNPDYIWFQDRVPLPDVSKGGWPREALTLLWRPVGEAWLPEAKPNFVPTFNPVYVFPSIGWGFMAPRQPDPLYFLAFKNGSLAANHTHLDLNHVSVGYKDTMLAVELGSRPYPADYFTPARYGYYEIGTPGHNTVLIGGKGQVHGKPGKLLGPLTGNGYTAFIGVADGAYEKAATRARRHVVFVNNRYWVLLDEIQTPQPESAELRFHTYGKVTETAPRRWMFEEDQAALDVVSTATQQLLTSLETPQGWIKPTKALSIKSATPALGHMIVTVLNARAKSAPALGQVVMREQNQDLVISVDKDRISFRKTLDGWQIKDVRALK